MRKLFAILFVVFGIGALAQTIGGQTTQPGQTLGGQPTGTTTSGSQAFGNTQTGNLTVVGDAGITGNGGVTGLWGAAGGVTGVNGVGLAEAGACPAGQFVIAALPDAGPTCAPLSSGTSFLQNATRAVTVTSGANCSCSANNATSANPFSVSCIVASTTLTASGYTAFATPANVPGIGDGGFSYVCSQ
jgi:hypothetical protein